MKSSIVVTALFAINRGASALIATPITGQFSNRIPGEIDVQQAFAKSSFPISPDDLLNRAREVLSPQISIGTMDDGDCLADDFEFVAAVVGPLPKEEYLAALGSFKLTDSFGIEQNYFGFSVDPIQTNRVWFFNRAVSTHIAPFMGAKPEDTINGGVLNLPPQVYHIDFNENGLVKEFGFYTVDRRQGNTGGLGGAFGYFYGVGKPLPIRECQPYQPSFRFRMLNFIGKLGEKLAKKKTDQ
mmetsp:Transcript_10079/g.24679  ORF Transcript_10079/g.24679 Transcript_10079/m.24679 type:complete len:241 (-) Transcript_10079:754-1476(-)